MRILSSIVVLGFVFLLVLYASTHPLKDFVEYWVAGHQLVAGNNPYSISESFRLERALGWGEPAPLTILNAPWVLPCLAPLGMVKSYVAGWLIWFLLLTGCVWFSTKLLLEHYGKGHRIFPNEPKWREPLLAYTFLPTIVCLKFTQITPFILLGIAGFLWCNSRQRDFLAGACLALATIKPHLVYLIWIAVVLQSWQTKKWRTLFSLASVLGGFTMLAVLFRRSLLADYWVLTHSGYARIYPSALGAALRYPFPDLKYFPLQFVAPALGTVWFLFYWRRHHKEWDWDEQMPILITVSVLTSAYGWVFDQIMLVVPIVAIAAAYAHRSGRLPRVAGWVYTLLNIALLIGVNLHPVLPYSLAPVVVVLFLYALSPGGRRGQEKLRQWLRVQTQEGPA